MRCWQWPKITDVMILRFKKNLNRAGTTLMQKTGQIERTVDREFADEEVKYKA